MVKVETLEDLRVWREGHLFVLEIYKITKEFPKEELYGLVIQIRRAAVSVPANIAEGYSRETTKELIRYLYNARGSIGEVQYYLLLASDLGYITGKTSQDLISSYEELSKSINALIKSLRKKL